MAVAITRIKAGEVDGRTRAPRFIQKQLSRLHEALVANASILREAIQSDTHVLPAEADVELFLAIKCVKDHYDAIDFDQAIKDEYTIVRGEDYASRRVAAGIVYVVPTAHTLVYSTIAPLSAAIAAGNCTVVELETSLSRVSSELRRILPQALDNDTFAVVDSRPADDVLKGCVLVDERGDRDVLSGTSLISPSASRAVALVDRTADIDSAAQAIVKARTRFRGKSPYAPDLVLVNEFVNDRFIKAVITNFTSHIALSTTSNGSINRPANGSLSKARKRTSVKGINEEELGDDGNTVVLSGDHGIVVHVNNRNSPLLTRKYTQPVLVIHNITSLDDGIDFVNSTSDLLATYHFGSLPVAKYTTQFTLSSLCIVNHIPLTLLLGPAAPTAQTCSIFPRYTKTMFQVPRPLFVTPPGVDALPEAALSSALEGRHTGQQSAEALRAEAAKSLTPSGQRAGKAVGFFDQGLLIGVTLVLSPVAVGLGVGLWFGIRSASRRWL